MRKHIGLFLTAAVLFAAILTFSSCNEGSATLQTINDDSTGLYLSLGKNSAISELPPEFDAQIIIQKSGSGEIVVEGDFIVMNNQVISDLLVPEETMLYIEITAEVQNVPLKGTAETMIEAGNEGREISVTMITDNAALIASAPWQFDYNWECNNVSNFVTVTFADDLTFTTSESEAGTWSIAGQDLTMNFNNGTVYTGTYTLGNIQGTMTDFNGKTGCFTATQQTTGGSKPNRIEENVTMGGSY